MRYNFVLVTLLAGFSVSGLTQEKALITGDVEDQRDKPIAGTVLHLRNKALRVDRQTTTDPGGIYFFADVGPAEGYVISAEAPGAKFEPESHKFGVQVGEQLQMLPPFIKLGSASKFLVPTTISGDDEGEAGGPYAPAIPMAASFRNSRSRLLLTAFDESAQAPAQDPGANPQSTTGASSPPQNTGPAPQNPAGPAGTGAQPRKKTGTATSGPRLDYLSTAESTVITSDQLRSLPFFNRNFLTLGLLAAGTHDVPEGSELKDTTFSISGERPTSNNFLLDGLENVASSSNQAIPFQVNDAIQEFRVVSATPDAQFGHNIGGVVNVVTQRGTAQFHGSVFGFFANDVLNATSPASSYYGTTFNQAAAFAGPLNAGPITLPNNPKVKQPVFEPVNYNQYVATVQYLNGINGTSNCTVPATTVATPATCFQRFDPAGILAQHDSHAQPFSSQQFGGRAGGGNGKRWFWFGDYEGTRINNPNPIFERVPSSFDRSHLAQFAPGTAGYQDALMASQILALYPQSNVVGIPGVLEFYQGQAPNYTNVNNYLGRLDFNKSDNSNWTARYNAQELSQLHDDSLPSSTVYPGNGAFRDALNQSLAVSFTHVFSDKLSNVARLGWTSFRINETPQDQNFNPSSVGLTSFSQMPTFFLSGLDPQYAGAKPGVLGAFGGWNDSVRVNYRPPFYLIAPSLDGLFPFARIGAPLSAPGQRHDGQLQLVDNVSLVHGKHSLRMGMEVQWLSDTFNYGGFSRGLAVSSDIGEFTSDSATCNSGRKHCVIGPTAFTNPSFDYALKEPAAYKTIFHSYTIASYLQDMWRVRPHLTLNLGLRYEYFSPPNPINSTLFNYDPEANGLVGTNSGQVVDMFGSVCGTGKVVQGAPYPVYPSYSVYANNEVPRPWNCATNGNANFLRSSVANFGPRVGISWFTASGNTVLRAGFGIFYDQVPASNYAQLAFNRPAPYNASSPQAIYGQNFDSPHYCIQCGFGNSSLNGVAPTNQPFQSASIPFGINAIDPSASNAPMTRQISASAQRLITRNISAEAAYVGNYTENLPVKSNTGFNDEWFCTSSSQGLTPGCDNFHLVPVFITANSGYGNYNALVTKLTARGWAGLQVEASYTYSKALDNGSGVSPTLIPAPLFTQLSTLQSEGLGNPTLFALGSLAGTLPGTTQYYPNLAPLTGLLTQGLRTTGAGQVLVTPYSVPQEPYNYLQNDYGRSDYDQRNRFILEYTWDIPARKASKLRSGWLVSGVFNAQSGLPFTIFNLVGGELTQRVSLSAPLTITGNPNAYIGNPAAIVNPALACKATPAGNSPYVVATTGLYSGVAGTPCPGDTSRNQFTGPAYLDYDMALQKGFQVTERSTLIFRAESYNLFNRANFHSPISTYSLDGVTPYSQFGQIQSAYAARQFQFAVRMNW